ncbi:MAG: hypothetical protein ACR2QO_24340 [Acidimicrobiales bacterium]
MTNLGVHLVGSVAMDNADSVFRAVSAELGPWLRRIPDGETGERHLWIYWQREMLLRHPDMEIDPDADPLPIVQWDGELLRETELVRFKDGVDAAAVTFETGYAAAARESYEVFAQLKADGVIGSDVRFQVSLPTPMASGYMYVSPAALGDYLPAYERSLLTALDEILAAVPHDELAIQWDVCQEVLMYEDYFPYRPDDYKEQTLAQLARLSAKVPEDVEVGFHLCYGTPKEEHLVMPTDTAICVEIANGIVDVVDRRIDFIHLPVPRERTDAAYVAPLANLEVPASTELYVGLIHYDDADGDLARIAAASAVCDSFGISTECGWGRADPARVPALIGAHRAAMEATATDREA